MGKQAMGMYVTNYTNRMDKTAYVMSYPMRPLVDTRLMNFIKLNNIPSGAMAIVAIMPHTVAIIKKIRLFSIKQLLTEDCLMLQFIILKEMKIKRFMVMKK